MMSWILISGIVAAVILSVVAALFVAVRHDGEAIQQETDIKANANVETAMLRAALGSPSDADGVSASLHRHDF